MGVFSVNLENILQKMAKNVNLLYQILATQNKPYSRSFKIIGLMKIKIYTSQILPTSLSYFSQKYKMMIQGFVLEFFKSFFFEVEMVIIKVFKIFG